MSEPIELKEMPLEFTVQVIRHRPNKDTKVLEPWPVATVTIDLAGRVVLAGQAGHAFAPLQQAFEKVITTLAQQTTTQMIEKLSRHGEDQL